MAELSFEDVTVRFGTGLSAMTAVDHVSLRVPAGKVVGLVGESGSGKSTLARSAVGLVDVLSGTARLDGTDLDGTGGDSARARRRIQMVFQDPYSSLNPRMTVGQSIAEALPGTIFPGRTQRKARAAEVARLLDLVGIDPARAAVLPSGLSGGQRQRIALARALAADPAVVLADEMTSALDVSVQGAVLNLVRDLQRQLGIGMLFISHDLAVVRYVSDDIAVMYQGRVVEYGPATDVLRSPQHPYTETLLAASPVIGASLDDTVPADDPALDTEPPSLTDPLTGCPFHRRCPVGPLRIPGRTVCIDDDPRDEAATRVHVAACHFATAYRSRVAAPLLPEGAGMRRKRES